MIFEMSLFAYCFWNLELDSGDEVLLYEKAGW